MGTRKNIKVRIDELDKINGFIYQTKKNTYWIVLNSKLHKDMHQQLIQEQTAYIRANENTTFKLF